MTTSADTVRVLVRVRPPNAREIASGYAKALTVHEQRAITLHNRSNARESVKGSSCYAYDHVCDEAVTQEEIFQRVGRDVVDGVVEGYHGCVLAYGQTGAGKTYTMQGIEGAREAIESGDGSDCDVRMSDDEDGGAEEGGLDDAHAGLIPRCVARLFERCEEARRAASENGGDCEIEVKCSYLEIYNETLRDLLVAQDQDHVNAPNVREDAKRGTFVENCREERVHGAEQTYETFLRGAANRTTGQTKMNADSSRSHSVFTISVESRTRAYAGAPTTKKSALLHLVDLAGSERQKSTDAAGDRLKEASAINKSLSALGNVIKALVDVADGKERHVPYRDSKLTFLLKDALGGRARCTLLACVSPAHVNSEETMSTLKFAQRAKLVKVAAVMNEESEGSMNELAAEVGRLRALLAEGGGNGNGGDAGAKILELEAVMAKASRASAAAAKESEEERARLEEKLERAKELCACLDKNLQSAKMVIRLRDEALKRKELSPETISAEIEELRKQNEHPPEVVRVRIELAALQERADRLQAENERSANRGRLATIEAELLDLRKLVAAEGELTARALEEKAEALKLVDEVDARNKLLESNAEAAERRAVQCEEVAENARSALLAAEVLENEHKMAKEVADAERARVQATFEENKEIMEEMFSKLEVLTAYKSQADKAKAELEVRLAQAEAAVANADLTSGETARALAKAESELSKAKEELAAVVQKAEENLQEELAKVERKHEETMETARVKHESASEKRVHELSTRHSEETATLKRAHEAEMQALISERDAAIASAKSAVESDISAEREAHASALAEQARELEAKFQNEMVRLRSEHEQRANALRDEEARAISKLREEFDVEKADMINAQASKLAAQAQAFAEQIEKISASNAEAIAAVEHKHAEATAELEEKLASALERSEGVSSNSEAHTLELAAMNEEHMKAMEELEAEYKSQIAELEGELAMRVEAEGNTIALEEHTITLQDALEEQKSLLSNAFAADIRNAERKLAAAKEEISQAKSTATAEFAAAGNAQGQIRKLQEELASKDEEICNLQHKLLLARGGALEAETGDEEAHTRPDARLLDSAKAARKRAEERAQEMEAKMAALTSEVDEVKQSAATTKTKYSAARSRIESLEVALHAAKSELAQLKGVDPPPLAKTPGRTPAAKRPASARTPAKTPGSTARRILSEVNSTAPPGSPSAERPVKHMRFSSPATGASERPKPITGIEGLRRGTNRLLSKPAMRVTKPSNE